MKNEREKVRQLYILNKMATAENQWLKNNLKCCYEDMDKMEKEMMDEKEKLKSLTNWRFWRISGRGL